MSLVFSNTTTKHGIIQSIERNCGFSDGDISGNTTRLAEFTADINNALDKALSIIIPASGEWQFDDTNHTDYPIITTNIVASQRDYSFTVDGSSNLILDIYKVFAKVSASSTAVYEEVYPVDVQSEDGTTSFTDGLNATGVPYRYDKTGNGIFLDPIPSYSATSGLKIYINREGSYFSTSDTTKKPGFAGIFHDYLALRPAYMYALRYSKSNTKVLLNEVLTMEKAMKEYYGKRDRDTRTILRGMPFKFR